MLSEIVCIKFKSKMLGFSSAISGISDIKMEILYWKFNGKSSAVYKNPKELIVTRQHSGSQFTVLKKQNI